MTDQSPARPRFGPRLALLAVLVGLGVVQAFQLTRAQTGHEDIYADVGSYVALREVLGNATLAAFRTDDTTVRALNSRRWRAQYSAMPTMLVPAYRDDVALRMARNRTRRGGVFHLVYEYRQRRNWRLFDTEMRRYSAAMGCTLDAFEPLENVVVYRLTGCSDV
jgi:hypothetical protein